MTVVNPKSISGINSITMASGSDNLLTIHTTNTTERVRVNSDGDVIVGSGITVSPDGDIFATGITTVGSLKLGGSTITTLGAANLILSADSGGIVNVSDSFDCDGTATFDGDVSIADKIIHTGDTDTAIRFSGADTITAETGGSERLRIDSSGRLLLGTTTEGQADADNLTIADSGSCGITLRSGTSAAGAIYFSDATSGAAEYDGAVIYNQSSQFMAVYTAQNERLRILSTGGITFNGDTATANALDDYEEGTFTPNYDAAGGVTFSYSQQYGFYTKIGDTVFFTIYLQGYASTITGGNENNGVALQGLPFTIKNHDRYNPAFTIGRTYKWDIDSDKRIYSYGTPNTTNARFIIESDDSTGSIAVASQLNANTTEMFLNGHYKI